MRNQRQFKFPIFGYVLNFAIGISQFLIMRFGPTGREVDVKDDSLDRWYVTHYRFDPDHQQFRHVMLKAFSNRKAQMKFLKESTHALEARKLVEQVPRKEHIAGGFYQSGYKRLVRKNRRSAGGKGTIGYR